jgi:carbonic anhydrase/acetyltransferase-like protein (isoleucine patch superfamily)
MGTQVAAMKFDPEDLLARLEKFLTRTPIIDPSAYVAPGAHVIGAVTLSARASVWPGCVLRADIEEIFIGEGSNVQDGSIVHLADDLGVHIGKHVTVGHACVIHACTIEDHCLIGMNATILDGAVIGANSIVGANSLVTKGTKIPPGSLVLGSPAKVIRTLSCDEQAALPQWAQKYEWVAKTHAKLRPQYATHP